MAKTFRETGKNPVYVEGGTGMDDSVSAEPSRMSMQRGVSQLLFNYLPSRTVDWEDGLAIVMLGSVRLASAWDLDDTIVLLDEIGYLFDRWRSRKGTIDPKFPDPRSERSRFTVGMPESIEAAPLNTALACPHCSRLFFYSPRELAHKDKTSLCCSGCGRRGLRQVPQVFVHGCGELVPITEWLPATRVAENGVLEPTSHPLRCPNCGKEKQDLALTSRSERVKDMKVMCLRCKTLVTPRFRARCSRCLNSINRAGTRAGDEAAGRDTIVTRILMRVSRYSASDTYYPQTVSMLRLDRPALTTVLDDEQNVLRRMLPRGRRPSAKQDPSDTLISLAQRLRVAVAKNDQHEIRRIRELITAAVTGSGDPRAEPDSDNTLVPHSPDLERAIAESVAFRETVSMKSAVQVCRSAGAHRSCPLTRYRRPLSYSD